MSTTLVLETESEFETALVIGVHNAWYSITNQGTLYGVNLDFGGIGNLFYANYNIHILCPPLLFK